MIPSCDRTRMCPRTRLRQVTFFFPSLECATMRDNVCYRSEGGDPPKKTPLKILEEFFELEDLFTKHAKKLATFDDTYLALDKTWDRAKHSQYLRKTEREDFKVSWNGAENKEQVAHSKNMHEKSKDDLKLMARLISESSRQLSLKLCDLKTPEISVDEMKPYLHTWLKLSYTALFRRVQGIVKYFAINLNETYSLEFKSPSEELKTCIISESLPDWDTWNAKIENAFTAEDNVMVAVKIKVKEAAPFLSNGDITTADVFNLWKTMEGIRTSKTEGYKYWLVHRVHTTQRDNPSLVAGVFTFNGKLYKDGVKQALNKVQKRRPLVSFWMSDDKYLASVLQPTKYEESTKGKPT